MAYTCRLFTGLALVVAPIVLWAQGASEAERRLDLRRAEIVEQQARKKTGQIRVLFDAGLLSRNEWDAAEAELKRLEIETKRAHLTLVNELPSFRLISAIKSNGPNGEILVHLELEELREAEGEAGRRAYLVSLKSPTAIISDPYQRQVSVEGIGSGRLRLGFRLLKDADELTILIVSGARKEEIPVLLQRDRHSRLRLSSPNYSLEGVVGEKADFTIQIERYDPAISSFSFVLEGLGEGFATEWWDAEGKVRITKLRFLEGQNSQKLILRVYIPAEGDSEWLNRALPFRVKAAPDNGTNASVTERGEALELLLRPTGAPRLILGSDNLLLQMTLGEERKVRFWVENLGGAEARNVSFLVNYPVGLQGRLSPPGLPLLGIRERKEVSLDLSPGIESVPGEFTIRIVATTENRLKSLESPEITFRMVLKGGTGSRLLGLLLGMLALIGLGFLAWTLRKRPPRGLLPGATPKPQPTYPEAR